MRTIKVLAGQTFADVAMSEADTAEGAVIIALENGMSVTDELPEGQSLAVPPSLSYKGRIFSGTTHKPASDLTEADTEVADMLPPERDSSRIFDYTFDPTFN
ncbi:MAG: hypothetical protein MJZ81_06640 [Bacteroidales bacterium]|nr:hypothetical protein [Bacteroidales bacterium]